MTTTTFAVRSKNRAPALIALAVLAWLGYATLAPAGLYDAWSYHAPIQFNGYGGAETLTNFPVLVVLSNNCFTGFSYSQLQSGSNDLAFTDASGTVNLNYEIEQWNPAGPSYVWVQVPALSAGGTTIQAWWGAPGQPVPPCTTNGSVWSSGFVAVWHMGQPNTVDSSGNYAPGIANGGVTTATGFIGNGQTFSGSGYVTEPSGFSNFTSGLTISLWAFPTKTAKWARFVELSRGTTNDNIELARSGTSSNLVLQVYVGTANTSLTSPTSLSVLTNNAWQYLTATETSGGAAVLYKNGAPVTNGNVGVPTSVIRSNNFLGKSAVATDATYTGLVDEVRIENVTRSSNWVWACYLNMASNTAFQNYGMAQGGGGLPSVANLAPSNVVAGAATFNATITATGGSPVTAVAVYWGPTDGGTNAAQWAHTNVFAGGPWNLGDVLATNVSTLPVGQDCFYTFSAANAGGERLAPNSRYLAQGALTLAATDASLGATPADTATLTVTRPATCTGGVLVLNYTTAGSATNTVNYSANPASGTLTIPVGSTSASIVITPLAPYNIGAPLTFTVSLASGAYVIGSANTATCTLQTLTGTAYAWSGVGATNTWTNPTNWSQTVNYPGIAGSAADTATFDDTAVQSSVNVNASQAIGLFAVAGTKNWTWNGAALTANVGFAYGSAGTSSLNCALSGQGGVTLTAGVLTNANAANRYTGATWVKAGVLDTTGALAINAPGAVGSNATPIQIGDPVTGADAELRLASSTGHTRDLTVQAGPGRRTVRGRTGDLTHSGTLTLNGDVVLAPGLPSDTAHNYTFNGFVTGTGSVTIADGIGTIGLGGAANNYSGKTIVNAGTLQLGVPVAASSGVLGSPASGNEEVLLGDTSGTSAVALRLTNSIAFNRPLRVRAGSSGTATLTGNNTLNPTFFAPITMEKDLYITFGSGAGNATWTISNAVTMAGSATPALVANLASQSGLNVATLLYAVTNSPGYTGGTRVTGSAGILQWNYPNAGVAPAGQTVRFGSNPSGGPGTITLDYGTFIFRPAGYLTLENPFVITSNSGDLRSDSSVNTGYTNIFTGPISLGGWLTLGAGPAVSRCRGTVTLDQSVAGVRTLYFSAAGGGVLFEGGIQDGPGPAHNSLLVRLDRDATVYNTTWQALASTTACTHAHGTFMVANDNAHDGRATLDITVTNGAFGMSDIWLAEGARLRLNQPYQVASGAKVGTWANDASLSVLYLGNDFVPALRSDAAGVLSVTCPTFDAVTNMAAVGGGRMFLGSGGTVAFTATTLAPGADGVYRLGGGGTAGSALTINNGILTGVANSVQVGHPCAANGLHIDYQNMISANGGANTVKFLKGNTYGGGTTVQIASKLEGVAQADGSSPFGASSGTMTLNSGSLQLDGATNAMVTVNVGTLTPNGAPILMTVAGSKATNTLAFASVAPRSGATPNVVLFAPDYAVNLGGSTRVTIVNNSPVAANNMVAPRWLLMDVGSTGAGDFLTYSSGDDAAGTVGFKSASSAYVTATDYTSLSGVGASGIANVSNSITLNGDVTVNALRVNPAADTMLRNDGTLRTITVKSGGVILNNPNVTISNALNFADAEGIVYSGRNGGNNYPAATLAGQLIGTNGVTFCGSELVGPKLINVTGDNSSCLTGTFAVLYVEVDPRNDNALGAPGNAIYLDGGILAYQGGSVTVARPLTLGPSGGRFSPNSSLTYSGPIAGPGLLTLLKNCPAVTLTGANNTYRGGSCVCNGSVLNATAGSTLGLGDVIVAGALNCYGDRNIGGGDIGGANTTNRQARLSVEACGTVNFYSAAPSIGSLSGAGVVNLSNTVLTVGGDNSSTIFAGTLQQSGSSTGSVTKIGAGTFAFRGHSTLAGVLTVQQGELLFDGDTPGAVTVAGGFLSGGGRMGGLALSAGSTLTVNLKGTNNYDQIMVNGGVNLGGATLQVNLGYAPNPGDVFYIVLNDSNDAVVGQLAQGHALAEGARVDCGIYGGRAYTGQISYTGNGDGGSTGNDVKISNIMVGVPGTLLMVQ